MRFVLGVILGFLLGFHYAQSQEAGGPYTRMKTAIIKFDLPCRDVALRRPLDATLVETLRLMKETRWEWGGLAIKDQSGRVCVSRPVTSEHPSALRWHRVIPLGATIIAIYHSHPGLSEVSHDFSPTDTMTMCDIGAPSFIVAEDGVVARLDPHPVICDQPISGNKRGRIVGVVRT